MGGFFPLEISKLVLKMFFKNFLYFHYFGTANSLCDV